MNNYFVVTYDSINNERVKAIVIGNRELANFIMAMGDCNIVQINALGALTPAKVLLDELPHIQDMEFGA